MGPSAPVAPVGLTGALLGADALLAWSLVPLLEPTPLEVPLPPDWEVGVDGAGEVWELPAPVEAVPPPPALLVAGRAAGACEAGWDAVCGRAGRECA